VSLFLLGSFAAGFAGTMLQLPCSAAFRDSVGDFPGTPVEDVDVALAFPKSMLRRGRQWAVTSGRRSRLLVREGARLTRPHGSV